MKIEFKEGEKVRLNHEELGVRTGTISRKLSDISNGKRCYLIQLDHQLPRCFIVKSFDEIEYV